MHVHTEEIKLSCQVTQLPWIRLILFFKIILLHYFNLCILCVLSMCEYMCSYLCRCLGVRDSRSPWSCSNSCELPDMGAVDQTHISTLSHLSGWACTCEAILPARGHFFPVGMRLSYVYLLCYTVPGNTFVLFTLFTAVTRYQAKALSKKGRFDFGLWFEHHGREGMVLGARGRHLVMFYPQRSEH